MSAKTKSAGAREFRNRKVHHDYFVDETLEAGIVLTGTEVKSIRAGNVNLNDSFVRINKGIATVFHLHISEYKFGSFANHQPYRPRRLLLNRRELIRLEQALKQGGRTLIPSKLYFKKALVKIEVALCRGKKQYDKRETLKEQQDKREMARTAKHHL